eukprot:scaffold12693_cov142-Isochrysis_galbana.AAC.2
MGHDASDQYGRRLRRKMSDHALKFANSARLSSLTCVVGGTNRWKQPASAIVHRRNAAPGCKDLSPPPIFQRDLETPVAK